jgi:hypothetical protein
LESTNATRRRIQDQLQRAGACLCLDDGLTTTEAAQGDATTFFDNLAAAAFRHLESSAGVTSTVVSSLRRSERDVFWPPGRPKFGRRTARSRTEWLVKSATLTAPPTTGHPEPAHLDEVRTEARRTDSFWQLSYNLACYYATREAIAPSGDASKVRDDLEEAAKWLETALERPGSGQMARGWLATDPDLSPLHGTPRFEWLKSQVDNSGRVVHSDG